MEALLIKKNKVEEILHQFSDDIVIEDLIDQIIVIAKIETALEQITNGQFITEEQLDEEIKKWR